ncbi:hypothetical protein [Chitinophaga sp. S165]|uniref:hypothetical protein n=1 Tax=Chitinophaga sp. S165 TaxID=2135462 RepID=UPI000D71C037|nr:hypothetical protein [Chitinophaga sp. S165]PWV47063.1 hypothetical protein C7475_109151 [Chitinophaga sp. S165]
MQIELKRIEYSARLSEETLAFSADIYIDGQKAGYASNNGQGGSTDYHWYDEKGRLLIQSAEKYCKSLPAEVNEDIVVDGKPLTIEMTLETFIDNLMGKHLMDKEMKAFQRKMYKETKTGIVFGIENQQYKVVKFVNRTIEDILSKPGGAELLKQTIIKNVIPKLLANPGYKILNNNIPKEIIELAMQQMQISQLDAGKKRVIKPPGSANKRGPAKGK